MATTNNRTTEQVRLELESERVPERCFEGESAQVIAAIVTLVACVVVIRRLIGRHGWW